MARGNWAMDTEEGHTRLPDLVPAIIERLPVILAEVRELLTEQQPDYAEFLAGDFEEILSASEGFIARLVGLAERDPSTIAPQLATGVEQALFEEIGRLHYQQQRELTPLLAAYRTGAAVAWRHVSDTALRLGVATETFAGLAAVVFTAVDQLSSASLRGYVGAQTTAGYDRQRLRDELAEQLLSDRSDTGPNGRLLPAAAARSDAGRDRAGPAGSRTAQATGDRAARGQGRGRRHCAVAPATGQYGFRRARRTAAAGRRAG